MVKFRDYLTYRGGPGHWSWILHRVTGVGVFLFLLVHIVDIALVGWGPTVFNKLLFLYRYPPFRVGEILLVGAVLYHALNGVRICIIDFWPEADRHPSQACLRGGHHLRRGLHSHGDLHG